MTTEIKACFSVVLIIIIISFTIACNNYDKEIAKQKKEIKILKEDKAWLMKQILNLESKDCSWLENFYYNHKDDGQCQCGVYEAEKGYIIDGNYYEYKGEADPDMLLESN